MTDSDPPASAGSDAAEGEPKRSRLGQILAERPEARPQLRNAVSSLLGTALFAIAVLGVLLIWHMRRRAQLIRDRLSPPRKVSLPDLARRPTGDEDSDKREPGSHRE
jgi:hypothetical protein